MTTPLTERAAADRADGPVPVGDAGPATPGLMFGTAGEETWGAVRRLPWLVVPVALVFVGAAAAAAAVVLLEASTVPALFTEHRYVLAGPSSAAGVATVVLAVLLALATHAVLAALTLRAGAHQLDVRARTGAVLREVARRWALVLGSTVVLSVALALPVATTWGAAVLASTIDPSQVVLPWLLVVVVWLVWLVLGAPVARAFVAALLHGVSLWTAVRRVHRVRRSDDGAATHHSGVLVTAGALVVTVAVAGVLQLATGGLEGWWVGAVPAAYQAVLGTVLLTVTTLAAVWSHVRATSFAEREGAPALPWLGLARVTQGPAAPPTRRRRVWGRAAVGAAWVAVPLLTLAPLVADVTPALSPRLRALPVDVPFWHSDGEMVVDTATGVAVLSDYYEGFSVSACEADAPCTFAANDEPTPLRVLGVASDPQGTEVVMLVSTTTQQPDGHDSWALDLVRCAPDDCVDPARWGPRTPVTAEPWWFEWQYAVAVHGDAAASVHVVGGTHDHSLEAAVCRTVDCADPQRVDLGPTTGDDLVRAAMGPDGTLWVLRYEQARLRLIRVTPGSAEPTDALVVDLGDERSDLFVTIDEVLHDPVLDLALTDDGLPVLLHRAAGSTDLVVVSCADDRCARTTSATVPDVPSRGPAWGAEVAVDSTGRPLVVTYDGLSLLRSCDDRACTSFTTGVISEGFPTGGDDATLFDQAFLVDRHDRPVLLVGSDDADTVTTCDRPRCGL